MPTLPKVLSFVRSSGNSYGVMGPATIEAQAKGVCLVLVGMGSWEPVRMPELPIADLGNGYLSLRQGSGNRYRHKRSDWPTTETSSYSMALMVRFRHLTAVSTQDGPCTCTVVVYGRMIS